MSKFFAEMLKSLRRNVDPREVWKKINQYLEIKEAEKKRQKEKEEREIAAMKKKKNKAKEEEFSDFKTDGNGAGTSSQNSAAAAFKTDVKGAAGTSSSEKSAATLDEKEFNKLVYWP